MQITKNRVLSVIAMMMMLVMVLSIMPVPASAATSSSGTQTKTIHVETKQGFGKASIKLKQTKGTREKTVKKGPFWNRRTEIQKIKCYCKWDISFESTDGSHKGNTTMSGGSKTIKLKPGKTYNIKVSWNWISNPIDSMTKGTLTEYPTWYVSSTNRVSDYW